MEKDCTVSANQLRIELNAILTMSPPEIPRVFTNDEWRRNSDHYQQKLRDFDDEVMKNDPRMKVTGGFVRNNCVDLNKFSAKVLNTKLSQLRSRESSKFSFRRTFIVIGFNYLCGSLGVRTEECQRRFRVYSCSVEFRIRGA